MKMPETPASYVQIISDNAQQFKEAAGSRSVLDAVCRYNEEYLHWDELRRKDVPADPQVIWALMKLARASNQRQRFSLTSSG